MGKVEIKRKKFKVIGFLLRELMQSPSEFKVVKVISYFVDAISVSDFKQIFADQNLRRLITTMIINSKLNKVFQSRAY